MLPQLANARPARCQTELVQRKGEMSIQFCCMEVRASQFFLLHAGHKHS